MTSIPASRSARAMILAPRSCPSRPGFATTTRMRRLSLAFMRARMVFATGRPAPQCVASPPWLEDRRFGVGAEHGLERLDDLAFGGVGARRVQERGHQVGVAGGLLAQGRQRALDGRRVPAGASGLEPPDLLALERGIDAQDLEALLVVLRERVDPDHDPASLVDLLLVGERRVGDLALREVALDRLHHA